jgi:hypothetical protein
MGGKRKKKACAAYPCYAALSGIQEDPISLRAIGLRYGMQGFFV